MMTSLQEIETSLAPILPLLQAELGVESLFIFGSVARGDDQSSSDVDVVVDFDGPADFDRFMELKERLEAAFGRPVDLVTRKALRAELRETIERESVRVA